VVAAIEAAVLPLTLLVVAAIAAVVPRLPVDPVVVAAAAVAAATSNNSFFEDQAIRLACSTLNTRCRASLPAAGFFMEH
jgi:hypothetical protein